jgi:hypothetical protein
VIQSKPTAGNQTSGPRVAAASCGLTCRQVEKERLVRWNYLCCNNHCQPRMPRVRVAMNMGKGGCTWLWGAITSPHSSPGPGGYHLHQLPTDDPRPQPSSPRLQGTADADRVMRAGHGVSFGWVHSARCYSGCTLVMDGPAKRFGAFEEVIVLKGKGAERVTGSKR